VIRFALAILAAAAALAPSSSRAGISLTLSASADGWSTESNIQAWNRIDATSNILQVGGIDSGGLFVDQRLGLEFALGSIASGATVNSAVLYLSRSGSDVGTIDFSVHGYEADGVITDRDFVHSNVIAGPFTSGYLPSSGFVGPHLLAVDVTAYVRALSSQSTAYAGFMLAADQLPTVGNGVSVTFLSSRANVNSSVFLPRLAVDYTPAIAVPEPSSLAMAGLGALSFAGVALWRRRV
jgi:hypothetical protein